MMKKPSAALAGVWAIVGMGVVSSTLMGRQAAAPPAAPTQPASLQAALANDLGTLSDKFVGLARVMAGKYDWRPAQGVRSVGEVVNLIVSENRMLIGLLSETPGQGGTRGGGRGEQPPITDPAEMQEALRTSYATLRQAVAALSDAELQASARMFGRQTTKQGALLMLLFDQHEHLGQSIAYARTNGVTPPWSR